VPGDHLGIMTAHFEALAAVLSVFWWKLPTDKLQEVAVSTRLKAVILTLSKEIAYSVQGSAHLDFQQDFGDFQS